MAVYYIGRYNKSQTSIDDADHLKQSLRLENKLPSIRFYSGNLIGELRNEKSIELTMMSGKGDSVELASIIDQVHDSFDHEVRDMNERYVSTQAVTNAVEHHRHTLIYFFENGRVDL